MIVYSPTKNNEISQTTSGYRNWLAFPINVQNNKIEIIATDMNILNPSTLELYSRMAPDESGLSL
jgi:hypothetical protein